MNVLLSMVTENVETMHVVPNMEVFGGLTYSLQELTRPHVNSFLQHSTPFVAIDKIEYFYF